VQNSYSRHVSQAVCIKGTKAAMGGAIELNIIMEDETIESNETFQQPTY
jgi:hypothetical protein